MVHSLSPRDGSRKPCRCCQHFTYEETEAQRGAATGQDHTRPRSAGEVPAWSMSQHLGSSPRVTSPGKPSLPSLVVAGPPIPP